MSKDSTDYENKYNTVKRQIEYSKKYINSVISNWFYPNSLKYIILKKILYSYQNDLSFLEGYLAYLDNQNIKNIEVYNLVELSRIDLLYFERSFNEIYTQTKINTCLC